MRIMIKRLLVVTVLVLALGALVVPVALADGGPHGSFGPTTDGCAGCHRAHTGQGDRLLTAPGGIVAFCTSCHGRSGQGASTDVESGVFLDPTDRGDPTSGLGDNVVGRGLKGGGFVTAKMDTDLNGSASVTVTVTSNHTLGQAGLVMWGNGSISGTPTPGPTTTVDTALKCSDCHNPHGNGAYRILRKQPTNSGATGDVAVADSAAKQYTVADENNTYAQATLLHACPTCLARLNDARLHPAPPPPA